MATNITSLGGEFFNKDLSRTLLAPLANKQIEIIHKLL